MKKRDIVEAVKGLSKEGLAEVNNLIALPDGEWLEAEAGLKE